MTKQELRETKDYVDAVEKIKSYRKGFEFTLNYANIPKAKGNALRIITKDCIDAGIIESIGIGIDLQGNFCDETYKRL
jgi:hypothetical protein